MALMAALEDMDAWLDEGMAPATVHLVQSTPLGAKDSSFIM